MAIDPRHNAVTKRLGKLQDLFAEQFQDKENAQLCLWLIAEDEVRMIESFVLVEDTEEAVFTDLFLPFYSDFNNPQAYFSSLQLEFDQLIQGAKDDLEDIGLHPDNILTHGKLDHISRFWQSLIQLGKQLPKLAGNVVVCLLPKQIKDDYVLAELLQKWLQDGLPQGLQLMIAALPHQEGLQSLSANSYIGVKSIRPNLDMGSVLTELAAEGDPNDPATQFRLLFVALSQAGAAGDLTTMREKSEAAINLCQRQTGWEHLEVSVLAAQGSHLLTHKEKKEAISYFLKAQEAAKRAIQLEHPAGKVSLLQAINFTAAARVQTRDWSVAAADYFSAAELCSTEPDWAFQHMEALRMAAYCQRKQGEPNLAWQTNLLALEVAENLKEEMRQQSTLPYVGQELLRLLEPADKYHEEKGIRSKLDQFLGLDWETRLKNNETLKP